MCSPQPEQVVWQGRVEPFSLNAVLLGSFFLFLMIKRMIAAGRPILGEDILELPCQVGVPKFFWPLVPKAAKRADEGSLSISGSGCAISRWEKWAVSSEGLAAHVPRLGVAGGGHGDSQALPGVHMGSHVDTLRSSDCCPPPLSGQRCKCKPGGPALSPLGHGGPPTSGAGPSERARCPASGPAGIRTPHPGMSFLSSCHNVWVVASLLVHVSVLMV